MKSVCCVLVGVAGAEPSLLSQVQSGDMASDLLEDSLGGHIEGEGGRGGGGEEATLTSEEGRKVSQYLLYSY